MDVSALLMKIMKTWVGFTATEKHWMACFSHLGKSRDMISKQSQITCPGNNSPNSLRDKKISFEIFMKDKKSQWRQTSKYTLSSSLSLLLKFNNAFRQRSLRLFWYLQHFSVPWNVIIIDSKLLLLSLITSYSYDQRKKKLRQWR